MAFVCGIALCPILAQPPEKKNAAAPVAAQAEFPPFSDQIELNLDEKQFATTAEVNRVAKFASANDADVQPRSDADKALIDKVVKFYLYRLTWDDVQQARDPARLGTIASIMSDLIVGQDAVPPKIFPRIRTNPAADQEEIDTRTRQRAYVQMLSPIVIQNARPVLQNKQLIARMNAARVVARLAAWGREEAVDELTRIILHPQEHDAVRLHAFQGLEEIFDLENTNDPRAQGLFKGKGGPERLQKALGAVLTWVENHINYKPDQLQNLSPGERDAVRYIRRAAVRALAASKRAAIVDNKAGGLLTGKVAEVIAKIASGDSSVLPAPDLRERMEAAIALSHLQPSLSQSYQLDAAAYTIGGVLMALGSEANADKARNTMPWTLVADRLNRALSSMAGLPNASNYVKNMAAAARPLFEYFDDNGKNPGSVQSFAQWMRDNQPSTQALYK